jgi:hypothetical protein
MKAKSEYYRLPKGMRMSKLSRSRNYRNRRFAILRGGKAVNRLENLSCAVNNAHELMAAQSGSNGARVIWIVDKLTEEAIGFDQRRNRLLWRDGDGI